MYETTSWLYHLNNMYSIYFSLPMCVDISYESLWFKAMHLILDQGMVQRYWIAMTFYKAAKATCRGKYTFHGTTAFDFFFVWSKQSMNITDRRSSEPRSATSTSTAKMPAVCSWFSGTRHVDKPRTSLHRVNILRPDGIYKRRWAVLALI